MMENKEKTVSEIIDEVRLEICDNYCRYSTIQDISDDDYDAMFEEICVNCPLNRL